MRPSRIIQNGVVEYVCSLIFPQRSVQWRRRFGTTRDLHHSQTFTKSTFFARRSRWNDRFAKWREVFPPYLVNLGGLLEGVNHSLHLQAQQTREN